MATSEKNKWQQVRQCCQSPPEISLLVYVWYEILLSVREMHTPVSQYGRAYVKCARSLMQRYQYVTSYSSHLLPLILLTCCQLFVSPVVSHSSRLLSWHYSFFSLVDSYSSHLLPVLLLTCCQSFFSPVVLSLFILLTCH